MIRKLCLGQLGMFFSLAAAGQEPKLYTIATFVFKRDGTLENMRVAYDTYGELNGARGNAILVEHCASRGRNAYKLFIGPGKAFRCQAVFRDCGGCDRRRCIE